MSGAWGHPRDRVRSWERTRRGSLVRYQWQGCLPGARLTEAEVPGCLREKWRAAACSCGVGARGVVGAGGLAAWLLVCMQGSADAGAGRSSEFRLQPSIVLGAA